MTNNKVDKVYWDECWVENKMPRLIDIRPGVRNYIDTRWHEYFCETFSGRQTGELKLLEIGCARSTWLPYFAKEFGFTIYGLDYSEIGCQQARQILSKADVEGEIVCADFTSPPENMLKTFDVVFSLGVAEHFENTTECIAAFSKYLQPEGLLITIIPNLTGAIGALQKTMNKKVYDIHVPLGVDDLAKAHQDANLRVIKCQYSISTNFSVINLNGLNKNNIFTHFKRGIFLGLAVFSRVVWLIEMTIGRFPEKSWWSGYVICVAKKED